MSIYGLFKGNGPSGFGYNSTAEEVSRGLDLSGKTFLVTGCNSGLGLETVRVLVLRGAKVIAAARTAEKAEVATRGMGGAVVPLACELSEPDSVRGAVKTVKDAGHVLSAIIANAGIMALPKRTVIHGIELQLFTNHFGHFLLVTGLLDQLADDGRVVMLSSGAHVGTYREGIRFDDLDAAKHYTAWGAYGQSKLGNLLFARELATRLPKPGQTANAVHPGVIATNLGRHMNRLVYGVFNTVGRVAGLKSIGAGAATQTYVAVHPDAGKTNGEYWADSNIKQSSAHGRDREMARKLWQVTEEILAKL
jgi:NAD(P)-dependent dehydrogenase (short-subunit alcohol dehydrogenase family)